MRIIVCVKQVPDIEESNVVGLDSETGVIIREDVPAILNPLDAFAVEEAVALKEKHGGEVIVVTMGPHQAEDALITCLSMGADQAFLLSDQAFAGADTIATAYALSCAIRKVGDFDLVFCGQQSLDGETGQVGPMLAENLHVPQITYVKKIDIVDKQIVAHRELEDMYELVQCHMPLLMTVVKGINVPRVPTYSELGEAMEKDIPVWGPEDLEAEKSRLGLSGSPTRVTRVWTPESTSAGTVFRGDPTDIADQTAEILIELLED